ncbi:DUF2249 domain-containing protein [Roseateles sp. LYH14W]|uniref:DUF2249 domain-containing protein n=1 Tax=Pelomonas parva TaxID=3299032 RepID=A0ABW7F8L0_9BURK
MTPTTDDTKLDLRGRDEREQPHGVSSAFRRLVPYDSLEVIVDRNAQPLCEQLGLEQPGAFAWEVLEDGPHNWRVRITKLAADAGRGQCCGSCGCA